MNFKRSERVRELLRQEISLFVQGINDPRIGFVTITGVNISEDLMDAKVYYSVLGSDEDREVTGEILADSVPSLRSHLGKSLESLYRVPVLIFEYDQTSEKAQKIQSILKTLSDERARGNGKDHREHGGQTRKSVKARTSGRKKKS